MKIKIYFVLLNLAVTFSAYGQVVPRPSSPPSPRVLAPMLVTDGVTVVHLRPGYVSAIRVPEEVSSVVLGNPKDFAAEHSEAEPRLVFLKPVQPKATETNVLITTKSGREVPLHLVNNGNGDVDFFLDFQVPRATFLIPPSRPAVTVAETKTIGADAAAAPVNSVTDAVEDELVKEKRINSPRWEGKLLQVAVGQVTERERRTIVSFSVLNNSDSTVELLPPQVQLSGRAKEKGNKAKAEQVPVDAYGLTQRRLSPGQRADGVLLFERPAFKESSEQLFLQVAQADAVDRPVLVPMAFTAPKEGETR